ncbi:hypothetical protein INT47_008985 [Mucor saturninus]|uniref:triacylglycerol lipase n=1 Tax=Mucor saturninus TaxID=64648 RepID=A0A8H7QTC0_9FUNG|nr:hypothetical protein INT47_008985 [Mucor saturninus]
MYTLLFLILLAVPIYAVNLQVPFFLDHHKLQEQQNTLKLKTIYHHASANGPIPKLFRKLDVDQELLSVNQQHKHIYDLKSKLSMMDRPSAADRDDLLLEINNSRDKLVRWNTLTSEQQYRAMHLESTIGVVPDVTHRPSVISLAMMTYNAYLDIDLNNTEWYDLGAAWHLNKSFGWETDGIRGHIFASEDDSLIVVSIKGTSAGLWTGGPTGEKDKINDNMLFSCCCARISRAWTPVCNCYQGNEYRCESKCLEKNISQTDLYYDNALAIFNQVYNQYPNSTIWLTGHSLGGAVASLVGITFGVPTVTFEVPGDRLAAARLHLPHPPGARSPIWHFGHTADPIFVGVCTGPVSSCWYGGYAMETRCHTGKVCVWDTVKDKGWRVDIRSHRVRDVIDGILLKPDEFPMPVCEEEKECDDCGLWQYFDERDPPFISSSTEGPTTTSKDVTTTSEESTTTSENASTTTSEHATTTTTASYRFSF